MIIENENFKMTAWHKLHCKYTPSQIAIALCNVSSDYIKYEWDDKTVKKIEWILEGLGEQAMEDKYVLAFYEMLYNIARRYYEKKIW